MTQAVVNDEKILGYYQQVHDTNKSELVMFAVREKAQIAA
jgi:hypothetical protein